MCTHVSSPRKAIEELRSISGASLGQARAALEQADGDIPLAAGLIKYQGVALSVGKNKREWALDMAKVFATEYRKKQEQASDPDLTRR